MYWIDESKPEVQLEFYPLWVSMPTCKKLTCQGKAGSLGISVVFSTCGGGNWVFYTKLPQYMGATTVNPKEPKSLLSKKVQDAVYTVIPF
jgi:hypothetical protein